MKVYDYSKTKNCLICGNVEKNFDKFFKIVIESLSNLKNYVKEIHPKELERQKRLALETIELNEIPVGIRLPYPKSRKINKHNMMESIIIVDGSNLFGGRDIKYYYDKLEMFNKILVDNNTHILFIRGNDDPKYFDSELINFSNIKTIQDYSVIKLNKFNCLCIGGYVSLDRMWKMEQEKRIGRKMYWENEKTFFNEDDIDKIIKEYNIACVITNSCPSFAYPGMNFFRRSPWATKDNLLVRDLMEERGNMDKIYNKMIDSDKKPFVWVYSRFKNNNSGDIINDIMFKSLGSFEIFNFNKTVSSFFGIDLEKKLEENNYVYESHKPKFDCSGPFGCEETNYEEANDDENFEIGGDMQPPQDEDEDEIAGVEAPELNHIQELVERFIDTNAPF